MKRPSEKIITNVLNNVASKKDAELVITWFKTNEGLAYLKKRIDKEQYNTATLNEDIDFDQTNVYKTINNTIRRKRIYFLTSRVAILVLPLLAIITLFSFLQTQINFFGKTNFTTVSTSNSERVQLMFQDGTQVFINPETNITFPNKFDFFSRKIQLNGEAYFKVAKNTKRPFIINLQNTSIKVLGTSFNVKAYANEPTVAVLLDEGSIVFTSSKNKEHILQPGEQLKYNKTNGIVTISKQLQRVKQRKGIDNIIYFSKDNLKTVLTTLQRSYNTSFVVKDSSAYNYSFTTSFKNAPLQEILNELQKVSPLNFTTINNKVIVKVKSNN